jgi:hypothetical protein
MAAVTPTPCRLGFGSLDVRLLAPTRYLELFPLHFRIWPRPDDATAPDLELTVVGDPRVRAPVEHADDPMVTASTPGGCRITTTISELEVDDEQRPVRAQLTVCAAGQRSDYVDHYVAMNVRALLRMLGRVQLHGAAVVTERRTAVFLGEKGAGKSTIALAMGRGGASVLADDQLILRVDESGVRVSGVDGGLRLTAETERYFFETPLDAPRREFGGSLKKEVPLADHVPAQPAVDVMPDTLYFPRVGTRFAITPLSRVVALQRILAAVVPLHRFAGARDQRAFLRALTAFVEAVDVRELSLTRELGDLSRLAHELGLEAAR